MNGRSFGGLNAVNFRKIVPNGFGDPHNSYPHAMTWFNDRLYVTTTRDNLVILKMRSPFEIPLEFWPVPLPQDLWDLDLRAQIWRHDPADGSWEKVHTSPMTTGPGGVEVPLSIAYRTIGAFQGRSDRAPALYVPTFAPSMLGVGSVLLRSEDGVAFSEVSGPGPGVEGQSFRSFRTMVPFKGRLFTAPTMGVERGKPNIAGAAVVLASDDPASGSWEVANEIDFGDPGNLSVFEMVVHGEHLYASTLNVQTGLQIWKTDGEGRPPFRWTRVVTHGAWRGKLNEAAVTMLPFKGSLFVGAAIQNGGYDRIHKIGPAAPELIRINPDDSWDLIVGDARTTPDGLKVPLSGMGPGFNNPFAGYFWQMCEHDGWLYLGTFDSFVFLEYALIPVTPEWPKNLLKMSSLDALLRRCAGFDLWRSADGVRWAPVSRNGFNNRFNYGVRTMCSTPRGLYVGATNPFGPDVAVRHEGGWQYEPNPAGGLEVWLGSAMAMSEVPEAREPLPLAGDTVPHLGELSLDEAVGGGGEPEITDLDEAADRWIDHLYGESGYRGFGYWREDVRSANAACRALVEEMASLIPSGAGSILEIATDTGESAQALIERRSADAVTGVRFDRPQTAACRRLLPRVRFKRGRWPRLPFRRGVFDHVICIDVPGRRGDRLRALREMHRVLKPGGGLVIADMLSADPLPPTGEVRPGDTADAPPAYEAVLRAAGFEDARALDRSFECWTSFRKHSTRFFLMRLLAGLMDLELYRRIISRLPGGEGAIDGYVLATARRPPTTPGAGAPPGKKRS